MEVAKSNFGVFNVKFIILVLAFVLASCHREPPIPVPQSTEMAPSKTDAKGVPIQQKPLRFTVVRQYTFPDRLAFGGERGVYLLTDLKTGAEFVGVSGVGVVEVCEKVKSHRSGKINTTTHTPIEQ